MYCHVTVKLITDAKQVFEVLVQHILPGPIS